MSAAPERTQVWDAAGLAEPHRQPDKARRVRSMFDAIAPTYERINGLASLGQDTRWRRELVRRAGVQRGDWVLDVACGTGDVARTFAAASPTPGRIIGCDFAFEMLRHAQQTSGKPITFSHADALQLPFANESFTIASCAFGIRNLQDLDRGLREIHRVLRPGGRFMVLEFRIPTHAIVRRLYLLYFTKVMPLGATILSGDRSGAYRYLPRSVVSFPGPEGVARAMREAGFSRVDVFPLTFGVVALYRAVK